MCLGCYAFSAMTLLTPGSEIPNSPTVPTLNSPAESIQVQSSMSASEIREAVVELRQRIPDSPEAAILREEVDLMLQELEGVTDGQQAMYIVDDGMLSFAMRAQASENPEAVLKVFYDLQKEADLQASSYLLNHSGGKRWGWLS